MKPIFGDTSGLKASQARALAALGRRSVAPDQVISATLARDLIELARELNRQIGLFVDRRGRVARVILGDAHSVELPEFDRVRGADGRLRGIRLVVAHLVTDPLNREELADLAKLRLDLVAAVHTGPAGIVADLACLTPPEPDADEGQSDAFRIRNFPRTPLSTLLGGAEEELVDLPVPLLGFLRELEAQLVASTARTKAAIEGTRALALMVHTGGPHLRARRAELRELCRTAGVGLVDLVVQRRPRPDPRTFFGAGKLREVLIRALEQDVEVLICDPELSASQARVITNQTDLKVIDRTMLILDIFAKHAQSADGKLQVELAQLRYRLPRMVGRGTMMSRLAGGIGGQGPGETKLEIDRRRAKDRIADLERRLVRLRRHREQQRAQRQRSQVPVVAIVGYTNAGKSTLLNTVTGANARAEDKLFATLDPTVRRIRFPREREIVLLDTVGFIRDLPPALMQAFSATLEEVAQADLLLHVVDATDPDREHHAETVQRILGELGAGRIPKLVVHNKCDQMPAGELELRRQTAGPDTFFVSALDRRSTRPLMAAVETRLWESGRVDERTLTPSEGPAPEAEPDPDAANVGPPEVTSPRKIPAP